MYDPCLIFLMVFQKCKTLLFSRFIESFFGVFGCLAVLSSEVFFSFINFLFQDKLFLSPVMVSLHYLPCAVFKVRFRFQKTSESFKTFFFLIWQPPALPHRLQCSTIGRPCLNRRVRYGYGCSPRPHRHQILLDFSFFPSGHKESSHFVGPSL